MASLKQWTPSRHEPPSGKLSPLSSRICFHWFSWSIEQTKKMSCWMSMNETMREAVAIGKKWRPCVDSDTCRMQYVILDVLLVLSQKYCNQLKPLEMVSEQSMNSLCLSTRGKLICPPGKRLIHWMSGWKVSLMWMTKLHPMQWQKAVEDDKTRQSDGKFAGGKDGSWMSSVDSLLKQICKLANITYYYSGRHLPEVKFNFCITNMCGSYR